jgi:RNA polymerase sigma-70 factor (family 1)
MIDTVNYINLSDSELTSLLQNSDHSSYNEIFKRYFQLIFVHTYKKLRDEQLAKDIVQDVFASLWYNRESSRINTNLAAYLIASVRNRIFDLFAHEQVKGKYLESLGSYLDLHSQVPTDYLVREREMRAYIEKQIQALPPKMRRVFQMSRNENLSHREIAERLGTTEDNVSKHVTNALRILRTKLGGLFYFLFLLLAFLCMVLPVNGKRLSFSAAITIVLIF